MARDLARRVTQFNGWLRAALRGPHALAFLPAAMLGAYWLGGETVLLVLAAFLPGGFALAGLFSGTGPAWTQSRDGMTGLVLRDRAERVLDRIIATEKSTGLGTAALALELDGFDGTQRQFGGDTAQTLLRKAAERLVGALRQDDIVARLDGNAIAIALAPTRRADIETLIQLSVRLQAALGEPFSVDATRIYLTASVGFCTLRSADARTGAALIDGAEQALRAARLQGPGSIRAYSPEIRRRHSLRNELGLRIVRALDSGEIQPWFQPQVSTDTGEVTGFEALARWQHPELGLILPGDFLPTVAEQGLQSRLGEVILTGVLSAMRRWDGEALAVPRSSVNLTSLELADPRLADRISWELDRFELAPDRLGIEILEDVIAASQDDVIVRNVAKLSALGCVIDLDDFGTGHASIANIRRFAVHRIKIDRSFVTRVDRDRDQQNMIAAILTMAERLELDTLAEGVETLGEHAMLSQLGCGHVQGFSVARAMPADDVGDWLRNHRDKIAGQLPAPRSASRG